MIPLINYFINDFPLALLTIATIVTCKFSASKSHDQFKMKLQQDAVSVSLSFDVCVDAAFRLFGVYSQCVM